MNDVHEAKRRVRRAVSRRTTQPDDVASSVASLPEWPAARAVLLFAPLPGEPDVAPLFDARAHAPRVADDRLEVVATHAPPGGEGWRRGAYGIWEPLGPAIDPTTVDLALVPGLAFAPDGRRLGRGGGFYDRLLPTLRDGCLKVGVAFDEQILDDLPTEPHDALLEIVVTPSRTFRRTGLDSRR